MYRITLSILLLTVMACSNSKNQSDERYNESFKMHPSSYQSDYTAYDIDSTWKLSVRFGEEVVFTAKNERIIFRGSAEEEIVGQGVDIIHVRAANDEAQVIITIDVAKCNQNGNVVNITYVPNKTKEEIAFTGCGMYNGSPKLFDIWVLVAINNEQLDGSVFRRQLPFMEINLTDKRIAGYGGCNEFMGQLNFAYKKIIPSPIAATKMYCQEESEFEQKFFEILGSDFLIPHFKDTFLILESKKGTLTFKKVD